MSNKPWDARIAATIVSPFANSIYVQPNHFTLLRLIVGLAGAAYFAAGHCANTAALLIAFSNFLDHTDGELARMTGKTSRFGHYFDLVSDAVVTISMFIGIGVGLARQGMDTWAPLIGGVAGIAVTIIFHLRNLTEQQHGKAATRQAQAAGFEIEDVLYKHAAVLEAAVVGRPDDTWGETPCAFVTLKDGAEANAKELIAHCRANMAHFKTPKTVVFGTLPKTSTGKVQKFALRERAAER